MVTELQSAAIHTTNKATTPHDKLFIGTCAFDRHQPVGGRIAALAWSLESRLAGEADRARWQTHSTEVVTGIGELLDVRL